MSPFKLNILSLCFLITISVRSHLAFEDEIEDAHTTTEAAHSGQLPKDKILLRDVKKLIFYRYKRTTSRRTHSIHQLSCVGGTAGCKLFTPDLVECEKGSFDKERGKFDWRCHAEISDRVRFNHVEVICEGYDYAEDDYILLGSCGLEFTLDYTDPLDHHENSYFKHMDEHEKQMHHERVRSKQQPPLPPPGDIASYATTLTVIGGGLLLLTLCSYMLVRMFTVLEHQKFHF